MVGKADGKSARQLARLLGRSASTISRGHVTGTVSRRRSLAWSTRGSVTTPVGLARVYGAYHASRAEYASCIEKDDSGAWCSDCWPRAGLGGRRLRRCLPEEPVKHVSHETIYIAIYAAPSGELRPGLVALLRQHTCARRPRSQGANRQGRLQHSRPVPRGR
ncbi:helix-turn-helix domain-containing protein [Dyella sp. 2RAB6]